MIRQPSRGRPNEPGRSTAEGERVTNVNRQWLFRELRHSLSLLAADGDAALAGVPDGDCKPECAVVRERAGVALGLLDRFES